VVVLQFVGVIVSGSSVAGPFVVVAVVVVGQSVVTVSVVIVSGSSVAGPFVVVAVVVVGQSVVTVSVVSAFCILHSASIVVVVVSGSIVVGGSVDGTKD
jgi:hypothetical protein